MRMENSSNPVPRFNKCCFVLGLRRGLLIFVSIEAIVWAIISVIAVYCEIRYIRTADVLDFYDTVENDWYYNVLFEYSNIPREYYNEGVRTNLIVLNLLLTFIFVLYFVFSLLLFIGIWRGSKCFFVPYMSLDIFFVASTLVLAVVGMSFRLQISKICIFLFFIKLYFGLCVFSLYKDLPYKKRDEISIRSAVSQHLSGQEEGLMDGEGSPTRSPGLGEAPLAVAV